MSEAEQADDGRWSRRRREYRKSEYRSLGARERDILQAVAALQGRGDADHTFENGVEDALVEFYDGPLKGPLFRNKLWILADRGFVERTTLDNGWTRLSLTEYGREQLELARDRIARALEVSE